MNFKKFEILCWLENHFGLICFTKSLVRTVKASEVFPSIFTTSNSDKASCKNHKIK